MSYLEKVVFAIDNNTDVHVVAKFLRQVDTLRAMNKIKPVVQCIGNWEGVLEVSYMMDLVDFDTHIAGNGYADQQECILVVAGDTRQPCHLRFPDGSTTSVGPMVEIDGAVGNWTYVPATNKYFTCKDKTIDDAMTELEMGVLDYLWDMATRGDNEAEQLAMSMELEIRGLEL